MLLGVNIDHVATLRNARGTRYPSPLEAALVAETHGADLITLHLREDRRHIKDADVFAIKQAEDVCIVPEKRQEVTTEGGLDVLAQQQTVAEFTQRLNAAGIRVSLFIDADEQQIKAARDVGVQAIELHTGAYADATSHTVRQNELLRLEEAAYFASELGLVVNAGHGLTIHNVAPVARILPIRELNIGHALIAQAVFLGLPEAIRQMKEEIYRARSQPD